MKSLLLCSVLLLVGCDGTPTDTPLHVASPSNSPSVIDTTGPTDLKPVTPPRFDITRVGTFPDSLAYYDKRGIYIIVDTKTGKEYVGVSGIGISELGSHQAGKIQEQDER